VTITVHTAVAAAADVPSGDDWLSPAERAVLGALRFAPRRADWRLGRWTARLALRPVLALPARELCVLAGPEGAPGAHRQASASALPEPLPVTLSISHREGVAFCIAADAVLPLGCDLELVEPRSDAFVRDYFTAPEQRQMTAAPAAARQLLANLVWSGKEAVLKAQRRGLRADTRTVEVLPGGWEAAPGWRRLEISPPWRAWWQLLEGRVYAVAADRDVTLAPLGS